MRPNVYVLTRPGGGISVHKTSEGAWKRAAELNRSRLCSDRANFFSMRKGCWVETGKLNSQIAGYADEFDAKAAAATDVNLDTVTLKCNWDDAVYTVEAHDLNE